MNTKYEISTNGEQIRLNDSRLPQDVVCLEQALDVLQDETLRETIDLAMQNGYWLAGVDSDGYTLEKVRVRPR